MFSHQQIFRSDHEAVLTKEKKLKEKPCASDLTYWNEN